TREDAEISATVANLRTLLSDVSSYYAVKGSFNGTGATAAKWKDITNVPLKGTNGAAIGDTTATTEVFLKVSDVNNCIGVKLANRNNDGTPAHIEITKKGNATAGSVCKQVQDSEPLKAYFTSKVNGVNGAGNGTKGAIAIGSSTSVYGSKK
ncbi:MAG: hypothetical protein SPF98_06445, partial [Campylobacter sp.]|nr:hypothetical protein [Campylobacter sp.]